MAQFTNQAQLAYNNSVTNSNVTVGEILEVLSATKTAVQETYGTNDGIAYVISIINSGTTAFTGITITDDLGTYVFENTSVTPLTYEDGTIRYYINGILQTAPTVTAGPPLVISGLTVPAGGNAMIIYEARTNQFAPPDIDATIANTATIRGTGFTSFTATETVSAESEPRLTITKSISPVPVTENGLLTYTFIIQNSGNTAADETANIVITDMFDPILTDMKITFNETALSEGTDYTYDEDTGLFTTVAGRITVPTATYAQDEITGEWITTPGTGTLVITGTV